MLQNSLLIALAVNGLFLIPIYRLYVLMPVRYKQDGTTLKNALYVKPFTCVFCMAFWVAFVGIILRALLVDSDAGLAIVTFPLATAFLAALIDRVFKSFPISF